MEIKHDGKYCYVLKNGILIASFKSLRMLNMYLEVVR